MGVKKKKEERKLSSGRQLPSSFSGEAKWIGREDDYKKCEFSHDATALFFRQEEENLEINRAERAHSTDEIKMPINIPSRRHHPAKFEA